MRRIASYLLLAAIALSTAVHAEPTNERKIQYLSWRMGRDLAEAALLKALDRPYESQSGRAQRIANTLKLTVPPMPEFTGAKPSKLADATFYCLNTAGKPLASQLSSEVDPGAAAMFELGLKSMLLVLLYSPGGSSGLATADAISRSSRQAGLPVEVLQPLLLAVKNGESSEQVARLAYDLESPVHAHFSK